MASDDEAWDDPSVHGGLTAWELHNGRAAWLADHIRRFNCQIEPCVAAKILELLDGSNPDLQFELKLVRRADLGRKTKPIFHSAHEDFKLAIEVARLGGFERANRDRACHEVALKHNLKADTVRKRVQPYKALALFEIGSESPSSNESGNF